MKKGLIIAIAIVVVLGGIVVSYRNGFVRGDERVNNAWANIQAQYQRRFDLIPNLVEVAKGSASFQQETFTAVTNARSAWAQAGAQGNLEAQIAAAQNFDSALSRLLVTVEAYPNLDTTAFNNIQVQLEGTENRIAVARKDYNDAVRDYNISVKSFPGNVFAGMFGFAPKPAFEAAGEAQTAPKVDFTK